MKDQRKAYLYAAFTVVIWSTVAAAFKLSLRYLDPVQLLFYASLTSTAVLAVILAAQGKLHKVCTHPGAHYLRSLGQGFLNPFLYYVILFKAYDLLPAQIAQPLNYTWALSLTFLSIPLLKQKIHAREITAGFVCYLGVVVIVSKGRSAGMSEIDPLGVFLALASTFVWACSWIMGVRDHREPVESLFLAFVSGLPFIFLTCLLTSSLRIEDARGLLGAAYVGIFEMGITFVLWLNALRLSENSARVGNLIFLSPFISLLFIHFLVGEEILVTTYGGLALIVTGLLMQSSRGSGRR